MVECRLEKVGDIIKKHGLDWSNLNIVGLSLNGNEIDLRNVTLPKDRNFFKKTKNNTITVVKFPKFDFNDYNFEGVHIIGAKFTKDSVLPKGRKFFKNLGSVYMSSVVLPEGDYSYYDFQDLYMYGARFSKESILTKDTQFFQKIGNKDASFMVLPEADYSDFNFYNVSIYKATFTENSKIPRDLFVKCNSREIKNCTLPKMDYRDFDFTNVNIVRAIFPEGSVLTGDKSLFQKVMNKNISEVKFPKGDYSEFNFKGVLCFKTEFNVDAKLPEYSDFLKDIYEHLEKAILPSVPILGNYSFGFTNNIIRNIHNYNLNGISLDLTSYSEKLTDKQLSLIRIKYKNAIGKTILLPEKGLFKENNHDLNKDIELTI